LGAGRHLCCSGRRYTYTYAHGYSNSDRDINGQPYRYSDSDRHSNGHSDSDHHANCQPYGNRHAATDANAQVGAIRKAAPNASAEAVEFCGSISGGTGSRRCESCGSHEIVSTRSGLTRAKGDSWSERQNSVDCFQRFR
jgi:hypothetical protein